MGGSKRACHHLPASTRPSPQPSLRRGEGEVACTAKTTQARGDAKRATALSPQRFGRVAQRIEVPAVWPPMGVPQQPSSSVRACPSTMLRALSGHFLWVTFDAKLVPRDLLGQQKKSDSVGGSRSKRPPRRRHPGLKATIEAQSHWIPAFAGMTIKNWMTSQNEPHEPAHAPQKKTRLSAGFFVTSGCDHGTTPRSRAATATRSAGVP
jgi:hypothetical protein